MDRWVCPIHMSSMPQAETLKSKCLQLAAANLSEVQVPPLGSTDINLSCHAGARIVEPGIPRWSEMYLFFFHISSAKYDTLWWTNSLQWTITLFNGKIHYKWPFSIAMLVHQRVDLGALPFAKRNDLRLGDPVLDQESLVELREKNMRISRWNITPQPTAMANQAGLYRRRRRLYLWRQGVCLSIQRNTKGWFICLFNMNYPPDPPKRT